MSERYWISGVQLGLLQELVYEERKKLVKEIVDKQFMGHEKDLKKIMKGLE